MIATPPHALELLKTMLRFGPSRRVAVEEALERRYLAQLHCVDDEPSRSALEASDFEFERRKIDARALREEIFLEALRHHPARREEYVEDQIKSGSAYSIAEYRVLDPGESQYTSEDDVG